MVKVYLNFNFARDKKKMYKRICVYADFQETTGQRY